MATIHGIYDGNGSDVIAQMTFVLNLSFNHDTNI